MENEGGGGDGGGWKTMKENLGLQLEWEEKGHNPESRLSSSSALGIFCYNQEEDE